MYAVHTVDSENLLYYFFKANHAEPKTVDALWGKLASEILMQNWDAALADLDSLKEVVDQNVITKPSSRKHENVILVIHSAMI